MTTPVSAPISALLARVPVGFHAHLMARDGAGRIASERIAAAERDADRLAYELLAPAESVLAAADRTSAACVLQEVYGLPPAQALDYSDLLFRAPPPPDPLFLERAWAAIAAAAGANSIAVVLGTERVVHGRLRISALVVHPDGTVAGFQDKVQLDPSEESTYAAGNERSIFRCGDLTYGIVICHEGWRYPETARWAARRKLQAMVEGYPRWQVLRRIVLPLLRPGIVATAVLCFIFAWNEFLFAFMLGGKTVKTLPVAIPTLITTQGVKWGEMAIVGIVALVPILIAVFLLQRHIVRGLTLGAVKG